MNVFELKKVCENLIKINQGDKDVVIFDPNTEDWRPIMHFIYSTTKSVRFYTDNIHEQIPRRS
jgi:hypothetical protein